MQETVEKLRGEGHEMIAFKVHKPEILAEIIFKNIALGGEYMLSLYNNDVVDEHSKKFVTMLKVILKKKKNKLYNANLGSLFCPLSCWIFLAKHKSSDVYYVTRLFNWCGRCSI